jgi:hypothetical protein
MHGRKHLFSQQPRLAKLYPTTACSMTTMRRYAAPTVVAFSAAVLWILFSSPGSGLDPRKVLKRAGSLASRSWEFGTLVEALLEFHNPELTVFASDAFPSGLIPQLNEADEVEALAYAKNVIWVNDTDLLIDGEGKLEFCSTQCRVTTSQSRDPDLRPVQALPQIQLLLG